MVFVSKEWRKSGCNCKSPPTVSNVSVSVFFFFASHCTRACDTLRVILSTFLPVIRENTDPWGACTIGVDVSREERQSKCLECKNWLLRIRCLPENPKMGSNLQQLQNMIVDI